MLKIIYLLMILSLSIYANDKIEIYATSIESKDNMVKAYDGVNVVYRDYYLSADRIIYNRDTADLELFGDVKVSNGSEYKMLGANARLNIAKKEKSFHPFYMLEKKSKVWISADEGNAKDKELDIKSGMLSGCNPNDPLWKMEFSSSDYNMDTQWINIYNARMYIYDIPVFYTPYFGKSLNKERRTGLLTPSIGLSSDEGFYYEQPIYIAEYDWWDLELKPQVRSKRGQGIYSILRVADSEISQGEIKFGYFKEKEEYFLNTNLANQEHYGYNVKYENKSFINQWLGTNFEGQAGLFLDIKNMNDVDYINLGTNNSTQNATATQLLSRVNVFYNFENDYIGSYFKYYKDLTLSTNRDTLQKLPTLHYHHYVESFLKDHVLFDIDMQTHNIVRDVNKNSLQTDINIPVTLQTSLFDEYLNVSYTSYFYGQHSSFSGSEQIQTGIYNDGVFARQYNMFEASTQVVRAYDDYSHSMGFGTRYTLSGLETTDGYYSDNKDFCSDIQNQNDPRCEFYNITDVDEAIQLDFTQYLFNISGEQIIYHRLAQVIANEGSNLGELENELEYRITDNIEFYNNMFFNYDEKSFSKLLNKITYNDESFNVSLSHLFKDTFIQTATLSSQTSYITSSARYTYDSHYSYHVGLNYDLENSQKKSAEIGFLYQKRCWDFGMRYLENNRPILTSNNVSSSIYDRYVYFSIAFKPFMSSDTTATDYGIKLSETLQGN